MALPDTFPIRLQEVDVSDRHAATNPGSTRRAGSGTVVTSAAADPLLGRMLDGRYRIRSRIARGGMATVYEATDLRLERTVAVKVMHPGMGDDDEFAARFVSEARSAARLSHPNVVAVYDQGNDDGTVFLAMELISGHTLRDTISKEAPMAPAKALRLLEPVVSALASAHRAGLVHRDVKPENVLIADDGRVKVADFGLAKAVSANTRHTATGVLIGTVSYVAPELVVEGSSDARADVYAVGVILYELLTGTKPHQGETPIQVAYKHVHEDVPAPSQAVPGIPDYVDALVARATARDREQRPADSGVLLQHLRRVTQALHDGVVEDPDLVSDLRPRPVIPALPTDTAEVVRREPTASLHHAAALGAPPARLAPTPSREGKPDKRPGRPGRSGRSRLGPILLSLALLVAAAVGVGAWWFGYARYTTTPGVIGLAQAEATERLESLGLEVVLDEAAYSDTVQRGRVISTDPGPGERVLDGAEVAIVVSLGKEVYDLPKLAGLTVDEAQDVILGTKLAFGKSIPRFSETVKKGIVISSDPKPGTTLRPGAIVDLIVSKGRRPLQVGDWVGKDADRAEEVLTDRGLKVSRSSTYSTSVARGLVISQDPRGGTLFRNDTVQLLVSLGPELVEVPSVRAQGVESATETLKALGFKVKTQKAPGYLGLGFVFSTDPQSGTELPKGSTVTLYLI
ncbi:Stk1 family PASTA domain-containing Ser/Thr kinase [Nocardioides sp.]|uniref:Stk1 family PASTA domain-containing Ser/Thr kinase n=1 Tax=Nocardioides sp. TaxID=35761 RepID=UPI0035685F31